MRITSNQTLQFIYIKPETVDNLSVHIAYNYIDGTGNLNSFFQDFVLNIAASSGTVVHSLSPLTPINLIDVNVSYRAVNITYNHNPIFFLVRVEDDISEYKIIAQGYVNQNDYVSWDQNFGSKKSRNENYGLYSDERSLSGIQSQTSNFYGFINAQDVISFRSLSVELTTDANVSDRRVIISTVRDSGGGLDVVDTFAVGQIQTASNNWVHHFGGSENSLQFQQGRLAKPVMQNKFNISTPFLVSVGNNYFEVKVDNGQAGDSLGQLGFVAEWQAGAV